MSTNPFTPISKRRFIKTMALISASSSITGINSIELLAGELQALPTTAAGVLRIRLSDFPALAKDFGSVRLGTSPVVGKQQRGLFPPILINRASATQFFALSAACTHEGCSLPTLSASTKTMLCPCHSSRFGIDGQRLSGMAMDPLTAYAAHLENGVLTIELPELAFTVSVAIADVTEGRLRMEFLAFEHIEYEVHTRASLMSPWQLTQFALSSNGPLDQSVFAGRDDFAKLFVPTQADAGFYAVAMRTKVV